MMDEGLLEKKDQNLENSSKQTKKDSRYQSLKNIEGLVARQENGSEDTRTFLLSFDWWSWWGQFSALAAHSCNVNMRHIHVMFDTWQSNLLFFLVKSFQESVNYLIHKIHLSIVTKTCYLHSRSCYHKNATKRWQLLNDLKYT